MKRVLALLAALSCTGFALKAAEEWQLSWQELGPVVAGKTIQLVLPDGAALRGPVLAVEGGALRMKVRKTSDRGNHPKGITSIPRSSVSSLRLIRRGSKWQVIGAVSGTVVGLFAGAVVAVCSGSAALAYATWGGSAVGGYGLGRAGDKSVVLIRVAPETSGSEVTP